MIRGIRGLRWWMISLLMLGAIINYLTRSTLAVAAPTIMGDLGIMSGDLLKRDRESRGERAEEGNFHRQNNMEVMRSISMSLKWAVEFPLGHAAGLGLDSPPPPSIHRSKASPVPALPGATW